MTERWEVRDALDSRVWASLERVDSANALHERKMVGDRLVRIRTYRVDVVYAWRAGRGRDDAMDGAWWSGMWRYATLTRTLYTDPLGKHSRRRAKAAALAAKPSGPCVLVAIRRRVRG